MRSDAIFQELQRVFGEASVKPQAERDRRDGIPTLWAPRDEAHEMLRYLKTEAEKPYRFLYDLTAIDERVRADCGDWPASDFTVVYHLLSFERNQDVRIKVALMGERPSLETITDIWPSADEKGSK